MNRRTGLFLFLLLAGPAGAQTLPPPQSSPARGDEAGERWTAGPAMPTARSELAASLSEGRLYVGGGLLRSNVSYSFEVFDINIGSWRRLSPLPVALHHLGMAAFDGGIFVSGGYNTMVFLANQRGFWRYDTRRGGWDKLPDLPLARAAHAVVEAGGRLYVIGGVGPEPARVMVFDPRARTWLASPAPLPTIREHVTASEVGGRIFVAGGRDGSRNLATLEIFDPQANRWTKGRDMAGARSGHTAAFVAGKLHVAGGEGFDSLDPFASHEIYDPQTDSWSAGPPMPRAKHGLASGAFQSRWFVIGGATGAMALTYQSLTDTLEILETTPPKLN